MRQANTTYLNLRATLDELDPFVEASKPVARKLRPYLAELRPFAREAVPTVRRLRRLVRATRRATTTCSSSSAPTRALADIATGQEAPHDRLRHRREGTWARPAARSRSWPRRFEDSTEIDRARAPLHHRLRRLDGRLLAHRRLRRAGQLLARADLLQRLQPSTTGLPTGDLIPPEQRGEVFKQLARTAAGQALPRRRRGARGGRVQRVLRGGALGAGLQRGAPRHGADQLMRRLVLIPVLLVALRAARSWPRARGGGSAPEDLRDRARQRVRPGRGRRPEDRRREGRPDHRLRDHAQAALPHDRDRGGHRARASTRCAPTAAATCASSR